MNKHLLSACLAGLLVCLAVEGTPGVSAQSGGGKFTVNAKWAQLPDGKTWDGSTSWVTADGKGNIIVLVRTAPYFRLVHS